jgi:hypothetical protein
MVRTKKEEEDKKKKASKKVMKPETSEEEEEDGLSEEETSHIEMKKETDKNGKKGINKKDVDAEEKENKEKSEKNIFDENKSLKDCTNIEILNFLISRSGDNPTLRTGAKELKSELLGYRKKQFRGYNNYPPQMSGFRGYSGGSGGNYASGGYRTQGRSYYNKSNTESNA